MNEHLEKLYIRTTILEYGYTKTCRAINYLHQAATNEILSHLDGYDIKITQDAEKHLEEECNAAIFDRRSKIDPLRQQYKLVDNVAAGKTTFSKEWEQYRIRLTGVIRMSLRPPRVEEAKKDFLLGFNACAKSLREKEIDLEEYRKKRITNSSVAGAIESGSAYFFSSLYMVDPTSSAILCALGTLLFVGSIESETKEYRLWDEIKQTDKKMKALYDI